MSSPDAMHPSVLELDAAYATDPTLAHDPELAAHVAECTRCAGYLRELGALGEAPLAAPPARPRMLRALGAASATLALAAGLLLFLRTRPGPETDATYVGTKSSSPGVQLLVRRAGATKMWDGRASVQPGDALALHVACDGHTRVTVAGTSNGRWVVLSEAPCPSEPAVLPFTLVVDDEPGVEHVAVIVTDSPVAHGELPALVGEHPPKNTWVTRLDLPKDTRR